ncbi:SURF1-like protein [Camelimonas fluminis]|uniref:SURF1-like protein n=1 Tax=Camelimonas fluminis TaxID=1576911 RepID=A0ABV7UF04_9HYPH|nr:SURF1 family protein [Camelimonas fluminis]GHE51582.1 SURF1-like protein [Camelimonas fluminis]
MKRSGFRLLAILTLALAGALGFGALGVWQIRRMTWKHELIARVESRVNAAPVAAPGPAAWGNVASEEYRRVRVAGQFLHDREILTQAVTRLGGGFWVLTPLRADAGFIVLVNRGFVPPERRAQAMRQEALPAGRVEVTGLLRLTEPGGGFLRNNDPAAGRWHSRDVAAIARQQGLDRMAPGAVAPYFIDAGYVPNPGGYPVGGLTVVRFSDNHLVYAVTWFALALMTAAAAAFAIRLEGREGGERP